MVGPRVESWREPWGVNRPAAESRARSVSPHVAQQPKPVMRLLSLAKEQENMWAQLVTSSSALEGQLRALRAEHEVLKLESQALRRCLDRAGLLSAHDVEKEMRQSGVDALVEAGAIADSRTPHLVAAAKQSAAALAEVERTVVNGSSGRVQSAGAYRRPTTPTPRSGTASDNNLYVSGPQRAVRLPARTVSPQGRGSVQNPAESPTRPVIIGGGGRRPASLGSLPAPTRLSAARLQVEEPSPTGTADLQGEQEHVDLHRQTLNQILEPFLDQASAPGTDQRALQALQRFLKVVPDPLRRWTGPGSPLVMVSRAGRADVARMLLRANANANDSDAKGVTALHIAVFDGNAELCKVLLNSRADVAAADRHGQTPLFFAPAKEICRLLVERRAEVGALNRKGQSALHLAGRAGFHEVLGWLSARAGKQIVDLRDHHGNTARMYGQQALVAGLGQPTDSSVVAQAAVASDQVAPATRPEPPIPPKEGQVASHQEFKMFQEPEEYSLATGGNTAPVSRHRSTNDDDKQSLDSCRGQGLSTAAALEAAAQVATAAVAAAAATTWLDSMIDVPGRPETEKISLLGSNEEGPQDLQKELQDAQQVSAQHFQLELDECW